MARTKASVGSKVSAGKSNKARCSVAAAPRHSAGPGGSGGGGGGGSAGSGPGGNPVQARDTPRWQRPITRFFSHAPARTPAHAPLAPPGDVCPAPPARLSRAPSEPDDSAPLQPDDSAPLQPDDSAPLQPDDSAPLQPLSGERSHKLHEYYPPAAPAAAHKGKGVGKTTKGKENYSLSENNKREREDSLEESASKKIKI